MTEEQKNNQLDPPKADEAKAEEKPTVKISAKPTINKTPPVKQNSNKLLYILFMLVLGGTLALGYLGYTQHLSLQQQLADMQQHSGSYQSQIDAVQQMLSKQNQDLLARLKSTNDKLVEDMQGLTDQMIVTNDAINTLSGPENKSWYADEAYYLIRIANNRLLFMQDVKTAIHLLTEADKLLGQIDDPSLFATRQKVNEDRQRLNAWPKIDSTGLAIRISALQTQVAQLPMLQIIQDEQEVIVESIPETWYEHLLQSLEQLGDQWFTVRHHGTGYSPVISEADEQKLRFAMMMTLQTLQYSVLYHNDDLYQANLLQLKSRLQNYFDTEDSAVQTLIIEIDELLQVSIGHEEFDGLISLPALSTYLLQREQNGSVEDET